MWKVMLRLFPHAKAFSQTTQHALKKALQTSWLG